MSDDWNNDNDDRYRRNDDDEDAERRRREEEANAERQRKREEREQRERKEQEEASKKVKKTGQKRKGLGGLSKEKKRKLKELIMQKAAEEMRAEAKRRQEAKENHLKSVVGPLNTDGLDQNGLTARVNELNKRVNQLEEEKYDWEQKLHKQDEEMNDLNMKVNDVKGKFVKPVLKKVPNTERTFAKYDDAKKGKSIAGFRGQLKSTGQSKFALDEKDDEHNKPDWRDHLKESKGGAESGANEVAVAE